MSDLPKELYTKNNAKEHGKHETEKKDVPAHQGNPNKRVHDKQSGTGRGKEISKNGAGGKFTWGTNGNDLEKQAYQDEENFEKEAAQQEEEDHKENEEKK